MRSIFPVDRWSLLVLAGSSALLFGVLCADYFTSPSLLLFYLAVQVIVGSVLRGYWWAVMALVATSLWLIIRRTEPGADAINNGVLENWSWSAWNSLQRLAVLGLVGFLCSRLRQFSRSPEALDSSHDSTGLLSATGLRETLGRRHTIERLSQGPVAVLLLDLERRVSAYAGQSSEHGALVGAMISKVVMNHARATDLCARLSPNHFLVIMPDTDQSTAATLNAAVLDALPEMTRSLDDSVSVSTLLLYSPTPVANMNKMRVYAENRLITLKVLGMGKNHSEVWTRAQQSLQAPVTTG